MGAKTWSGSQKSICYPSTTSAETGLSVLRIQGNGGVASSASVITMKTFCHLSRLGSLRGWHLRQAPCLRRCHQVMTPMLMALSRLWSSIIVTRGGCVGSLLFSSYCCPFAISGTKTWKGFFILGLEPKVFPSLSELEITRTQKYSP